MSPQGERDFDLYRWVLGWVYSLCAVGLSIYGLNSLLLTVLYLWPRGKRAREGASAGGPSRRQSTRVEREQRENPEVAR